MNEHDEALLDRLELERELGDPWPAPPGSPLAKARMRAHQALDPLWQSGQMTRKEAYKWLSRMMGIPRSRCHIIQFTEGDCLEVIRLCRLETLRRTGE